MGLVFQPTSVNYTQLQTNNIPKAPVGLIALLTTLSGVGTSGGRGDWDEDESGNKEGTEAIPIAPS